MMNNYLSINSTHYITYENDRKTQESYQKPAGMSECKAARIQIIYGTIKINDDTDSDNTKWYFIKQNKTYKICSQNLDPSPLFDWQEQMSTDLLPLPWQAATLSTEYLDEYKGDSSGFQNKIIELYESDPQVEKVKSINIQNLYSIQVQHAFKREFKNNDLSFCDYYAVSPPRPLCQTKLSQVAYAATAIGILGTGYLLKYFYVNYLTGIEPTFNI